MQQFSVVISGFDRYDGIDVNPSFEVPRALAEQGLGISTDIDDPLSDVSVTIHTVGLPISFTDSWPELKRMLDAVRPDIVIATGLKRSARGIALERCATNLMDAANPEDAAPRRTPIDPEGPAAYWTASQERVLSGFVSFPKVVESAHSPQGLPLDRQIAACRAVVREAIRYHLRPSSEEILLD